MQQQQQQSSLDPYKVFKVTPGAYTPDMIKDKYKRLAIKLHPDKNPDPRAAQLFQTIRECYMFLLEDYCARMSDRPSHELKAESARFQETQARDAQSAIAAAKATRGTRGGGGRGRPTVDSSTLIGKKDFDLSKFNRLFSDNREDDPQVDSGYGDWMKATPAEEAAAIAVQKQLQMQMYKEPQAAFGPNPAASYELGGQAVSDYSAPPIAAGSKKDLMYTDYRIAHTTTKLMDDIDPTSYRQDYKNVNHLQSARASMPMHLTAEDMAKQFEPYPKPTEYHGLLVNIYRRLNAFLAMFV